MIRIFFGQAGGGPPSGDEAPDFVVRDLAELRSLARGREAGSRPSSEAEREIMIAVAERLARDGEDRDVDVRASSAVFRIFPGSSTPLSGPTLPRGKGEHRPRTP
ncbi:hypothetical protein HY251_02410 [bacterium]|nr:hypothetical protein [bacterium]